MFGLREKLFSKRAKGREGGPLRQTLLYSWLHSFHSLETPNNKKKILKTQHFEVYQRKSRHLEGHLLRTITTTITIIFTALLNGREITLTKILEDGSATKEAAEATLDS